MCVYMYIYIYAHPPRAATDHGRADIDVAKFKEV